MIVIVFYSISTPSSILTLFHFVIYVRNLAAATTASGVNNYCVCNMLHRNKGYVCKMNENEGVHVSV